MLAIHYFNINGHLYQLVEHDLKNYWLSDFLDINLQYSVSCLKLNRSNNQRWLAQVKYKRKKKVCTLQLPFLKKRGCPIKLHLKGELQFADFLLSFSCFSLVQHLFEVFWMCAFTTHSSFTSLNFITSPLMCY